MIFRFLAQVPAGKVKKIGKDDLNGKNVPFYLLISNKCCDFAVELTFKSIFI